MGEKEGLIKSQLKDLALSMLQNRNYSEKSCEIVWYSYISWQSLAVMVLQYKEEIYNTIIHLET